MFQLEDKYKKPNEFKKYVLEVAYKELKEKADVWFEYSMKKASKGEYYVNFKLFTKDLVILLGLLGLFLFARFFGLLILELFFKQDTAPEQLQQFLCVGLFLKP